MSPIEESRGVYTFIPWLRRGLAGFIQTEDRGESSQDAQAKLTIKLKLAKSRAVLDGGSVKTIDSEDTVQLRDEHIRLFGPGDITGIDAREIVRVEPAEATRNFEPNYFPAIEFGHPDFPWLFTPLRANEQHRLRPWVVLIVVKKDAARLLADPEHPLSVITVNNPNELPDLRESWAWAHVQVAGDLQSHSLADLLKDHPERIVSRIFCPRQLAGNTDYYACLVPAFEAGRKTGLGEKAGLEGESKLEPAWKHTHNAPVDLPVYYRWEFTTGDAGDFASLVKLLKARPVPEGIGRRPLDIGDPGFDYGQPNGDGQLLVGLEGALQSPASEATPWPAHQRQPFQEKLLEILNAPAASTDSTDPTDPDAAVDGAGDAAETAPADPVVAPPIYGGRHATTAKVPEERAAPYWLGSLNRDPRYRVAAGFGTKVVQKHQEHLMASAWEQVGDLEEVNALLRLSQLGREVSSVVHEKQIGVLSPDALLPLTSPLHSRISLGPVTVRQRLSESPVPLPVLSPAFRRLTRPAGPFARQLFGTAQHHARALIQRLNRGEITAAKPRTPPAGTVLMDDVSGSLYHPLLPAWLRRWLPYAHLFLAGLALLLLALGLIINFLSTTDIGTYFILACVLVTMAAARLRPRALIWEAARDGRLDRASPERLHKMPGRPKFTVVPSGANLSENAFARERGADSVDAAHFRSAAAAHQDMLLKARSIPGLKTPAPVNLEELSTELIRKVDPEVTIPRRILGRIHIPDDLRPSEDPLEPVLVVPRFPQPMYETLKELAEECFLPGLAGIQPNTITLLETNSRFVEAYMVGLNHEMARELLWRGYPTDQRGTYFRRFWETAAEISDSSQDHENDIDAIHTWPATNDLGQNMRQGQNGRLVLLIRGELIRRYPGVMIYAVQGEWTEDGERKRRRPIKESEASPDGNKVAVFPSFRGALEPDINLLGFELDKNKARGSRDPDKEPGWFFIIQEQPTEPRFGLDAANWQVHVRQNTATGASLAKTALCKPFRVAVHADHLLP